MRRKVGGAVWESGMNPEQIDGIYHDDGPCRIMASPGSGKTRVITHRIARMVIRDGVDPDEILAVTFSKKAAGEMASRTRKLGVARARIGTWHSLCLQILKEDHTRWMEWEIDERDAARYVLKDVIGHKGMNWHQADFGQLRRFIGLCKANLHTHDSDGAIELAAKMLGQHDAMRGVEAFGRYQEILEERGILTFDDFLVFTHRHLREESNRARWAGRWDHMIQDEAQDANHAQDAIAEMLCREHRNYMVVGDPAQSIYSFRGSSPSIFMDFTTKWNARDIVLKRNYRSSPEIVELVNNVIRPSATRLPEDMIAERPARTETPWKLVRAFDFDGEAEAFADWIDPAASLSSYCALFRTNAQSRALEESLLRRKIPYVVVGGVSFYDRKEVKDLLAYLRVVADRDDEGDAIRRCINAPFRFLGKAFVDLVERNLRGLTDDPVEAVRMAGNDAKQSRQTASANEWAALVTVIRDILRGPNAAHEGKPSKILSRIIEQTRYITWLEKEEGKESLESSAAANARELVRVAEKFDTVDELLDYIEETQRAAKRQRRDDQAGGERVLLMSIHRSKGLEWPNVWLVGANEAILPHIAAEDMEEERRLFYVAISRARDNLVVSFVHSMATRAGIRDAAPSMFVRDAFPADAVAAATTSAFAQPRPPAQATLFGT